MTPLRLSAGPGDPPPAAAVREGAPWVAALGALAVAAFPRWPRMGAAVLGLAAGTAWFFRDPVRVCPAEPDVLYAPADGVIQTVDEVAWDWFIHGPALRIVTFLSIADVHVNRSPAAGRLVAYRRDPGTFAPAFLLGRSGQNARQLLGIEGARGNVVVAQVVGLVARRIVSWRLPGDSLRAGQKLGMIRFGSRTDLLVPAGDAAPLVAKGAVVRAGLTPLARYVHRAVPAKPALVAGPAVVAG